MKSMLLTKLGIKRKGDIIDIQQEDLYNIVRILAKFLLKYSFNLARSFCNKL